MKSLMRGLSVLAPLLISGAAFASGGGEGAGAEGGHHLNIPYVISLIFNFVAVAVLLFVLLRKPVASYFAERSRDVADKLGAAERARASLDAKMKEYKGKMDELMATREDVLKRAREEAEYEKERIVTAAHRQAEFILSEAQRAVNVEFERAKQELGAEFAETIATEAERLLVKSVTGEDGVRLADDYIENLREVKRA